MKFNLAKTDKGYAIPADGKDEEKFRKVGVGEVFECKSIDQRNYRFLQKYWALVDMILQNLPESVENNLMQNHQFRIKTKEDVHFYIKLKNGYVEKRYINDKGNVGWEVKSIAFGKMKPEEFEEFFSKAVDTACELLTVGSDDIMKEIMNFV
ncbi:hypothetical protein [Gracilimonas sp.]|uniref:hypothetical protein n=1 Tax=Gracilimonas sp. TaxID=1974203 RepID=UPI0028724EB7|nr:hypothetical protein [Gracilimonas sp.]